MLKNNLLSKTMLLIVVFSTMNIDAAELNPVLFQEITTLRDQLQRLLGQSSESRNKKFFENIKELSDKLAAKQDAYYRALKSAKPHSSKSSSGRSLFCFDGWLPAIRLLNTKLIIKPVVYIAFIRLLAKLVFTNYRDTDLHKRLYTTPLKMQAPTVARGALTAGDTVMSVSESLLRIKAKCRDSGLTSSSFIGPLFEYSLMCKIAPFRERILSKMRLCLGFAAFASVGALAFKFCF